MLWAASMMRGVFFHVYVTAPISGWPVFGAAGKHQLTERHLAALFAACTAGGSVDGQPFSGAAAAEHDLLLIPATEDSTTAEDGATEWM